MKRLVWRTAAAVAAAVAVAAMGFLVYTSVRIERQSVRDEAQPADVILVLGAAQYSGRPSPVLRARLDHALDLYRRHLAPRIMTTGGAGGDKRFTEGSVGRAYLIAKGVPSEALIVEGEGESTVHSTALAAEIMRRMGLRSVIVVSDGYHIFRVRQMLAASGLTAYGSPRPEIQRDVLRDWWKCLKQAVSYGLWKSGVTV